MSGVLGVIIIPFVLLLIFRGRRGEKLLALAIVSLLVTAMDFYLPQESIRIEATREKNVSAKGNEIYVKSIAVDGKEVPFTAVFSDESWKVSSGGESVWRGYEDSEAVIEGVIHNASEITICFIRNEWKGVVLVTVGDTTIEVDCYGAVYGQEEISMECSGKIEGAALLKLRMLVFAVTFLAMLILNFIIETLIRRKHNPERLKSEEDTDSPINSSGIKQNVEKIIVTYSLIVFGMSANRFNGWVRGNNQTDRLVFLILALISSVAIGYLFLQTGWDYDQFPKRKSLLMKIAGLFLGYLGTNVILHLEILVYSNDWQKLWQVAIDPKHNYSQLFIMCFVVSGLIYTVLLFLLRNSETQVVKRISTILWICSWWGYALVLIAYGSQISNWVLFFFILSACGLLLRGSIQRKLERRNEPKWTRTLLISAGACGTGLGITLIVSILRGGAANGYLFFGPALVVAGLAMFDYFQSAKETDWLFSDTGKVRLAAMAELSVTAYFVHIYIKNHLIFPIGHEKISAIGLDPWHVLMSAFVYYALALMIAYMLHRIPFVRKLKSGGRR